MSCFAQTGAMQKLIVVRDNVDYPPLEYHENGKLTGFHVELVNIIAKKLNMTVEWQEYPWKRALFTVESGQADAITYISKTDEREQWALFNENNILSSATFSFLIRNDKKKEIIYHNNLEELLKNRTLLIIAGFAMPEKVTLLKPKTYEAPQMSNLVNMLSNKRYDLALINKSDFLSAYQKTKIANDISILEPPVHEFANYIAFSKAKKTDNLSKKFADELSKFKKTKEYTELKKKYQQ
jgi:polar amino acid transport system substrate-binding protein